jgi:hypothetical protein
MHDDDTWAELGKRLVARGLNERALRHCFGVTCSVHAPLRALALRDPAATAPLAPPPAALLAHLFVAGSPVIAGAAARLLGADLDQRAAAHLVTVDAGVGVVRAEVTILPVGLPAGTALVVTDRADRLRGADVVAYADDSALHTIGMVPMRAARPGLRWLDVGTGAGIVPLARPGAAATIHATDIHDRAVAMARTSVALSGRRDIELRVSDLLSGADRDRPWDRITFNAPIPASVIPATPDAPLYRRGPADILDRFWRDVRGLLAPGGEVIVHSWQPLADHPAGLALPGCVVAVRYTPSGQAPAFGVTVWQPDAPPACRLVHVALSPDAPHLTRAALDLAPSTREPRPPARPGF